MTISSVGTSSLLRQLSQARAVSGTVVAGESSTTADGQNMPVGGGKGAPPPPMAGWASSGQGFSADTLSSLLSTQQTGRGDRVASMFADADADGDGGVSAEELATSLAAHAPSDLPPGAPGATDMAARMLADGDADGDGKLSLDEFKAMKPKGGHGGHGGPPPGGGAEQASASSSATDPADLNGDGVVSAAELAQSLTSALDNLGSDVSSDASSLMRKLLGQLTGNLAASTDQAGPSVSIAA